MEAFVIDLEVSGLVDLIQATLRVKEQRTLYLYKYHIDNNFLLYIVT
jgi:hypothetical protein